jgi:hypothetical protein
MKIKVYRVFYNGTKKASFYSGMEAAKWVSAEIRTGADADLFYITSDPAYSPDAQEVIF